MSLTYRAEIDGLRTIAIMSVMVYHAKISIGGADFLKGGFLGVDIFFVISGFLITSIIIKELHATENFSFLSFYERRARRILPALFLVILVSLPFAWYFLLPSQIADFSMSILSTLLFGSNFYWFDSLQQYGAESALLKPFLHTWSLAVEEQYYIIFPLLLIVIFKWFKRYAVPLLTAGLLVSLGVSEYVTGRNQSISFYMLPTRFWELLAGSLLANILYFHPEKGNDFVLSKAMPVLGAYLILHSLFFIDFDSNHPGYITLLPVLGTILIIWFANDSELITQVLSSRWFVTIGLLSYSLYLWHYPIFAFGRILNPTPELLDKSIWIFLTFSLSVIGYLCIEKPFRNRSKLKLRWLLYVLSTTFILILALSLTMFIERESSPQTERLKSIYGANEPDNKILADKTWEPLINIHKLHGHTDERGVKANQASQSEKKNSWFSGSPTTKVLIIGDSHSKDLFNAFYLNQELYQGYEFARYGIDLAATPTVYEVMRNSPNFMSADVVIISERYCKQTNEKRLNCEQLKALPRLIEKLQQDGKSILLTSNTPEFGQYNGYENIFDGYLREKEDAYSRIELQKLYYRHQEPLVNRINMKLKEVADKTGVIYVDKFPLICNESLKRCDGDTNSGIKLFYDYGHYTLEGAKYLGKKIFKASWLEVVK